MAKITAWENIVLLIIVEDVKKWQKLQPRKNTVLLITVGVVKK
jgi:hypothetical protein